MEKKVVKMEKIHTIELFDGGIATIKDTENYKALKSKDYNFFFNKKDGFFVRFGDKNSQEKITNVSKQEMELYVHWCNIWKEKFDLSDFVKSIRKDGSEINGVLEIVDIEISTVPCKNICKFCYKNNTGKGENMSLETYKKILSKLEKTVTQVAFGITDVDANPEMWDIFEYTRSKGIVPNVTINCKNISQEDYDKLAKYCGAVACSFYNEDECFNSIKELTDRGMTQINIHHMIHSDNFEQTMDLFKKSMTDDRLKNLNAIVLLSMKPVGLAKTKFKKLSQEKFKELTLFALDNNLKVGFDSCGSYKFLESIKGIDKYSKLETYVEKCESSIYSSFINTEGYFTPCSFLDEKEKGLSVVDCEDFYSEIWYNEKTKKFRDKAIKCRICDRGCSVYDV